MAEGVNTTGDAATTSSVGMVGAASKLGRRMVSAPPPRHQRRPPRRDLVQRPLRTLLLQKLGVQGHAPERVFRATAVCVPHHGGGDARPRHHVRRHTFERSSIEKWFREHSTPPMTGMRLEHTGLAPAIALRQLIENEMRSRGVPYP